MPSQRDPNKKLVGFFATDEEKAALQKAAKANGYNNLAAFLRAIATGTIKVDPKTKALAFAVMGASNAGCSGLLLLFGMPIFGTVAWLLAYKC